MAKYNNQEISKSVIMGLSSPHSQKSQSTQSQDVEYVILHETEDIQKQNLFTYISIIRRRKYLFIAPLLIFLPFVILYLAAQKPIYQSTATVLIEKVNPRIIPIEEVLSPERTANILDFYPTQYEIIKSPLIIGQVVDALLLYEKSISQEEPPFLRVVNQVKRFLESVITTIINTTKALLKEIIAPEKDEVNLSTASTMESMTIPFEQRRQNAIAQLQRSLVVQPRKGTELVDITIESSNPEDAMQIVNKVADTYIKQNLDNKLDASRKAVEWLSREAKELEERIDKSEAYLKDFKERKHFLPQDEFKEFRELEEGKLNSIQDLYIKTVNKRNNLKIQIDKVKKLLGKDLDVMNIMIGEMPKIEGDAALTHPLIDKLISRYIELKSQYYSVSEKFGDNHPQIERIKSEITKIKEAIYSDLRNYLQSMQEEYKYITERENILLKDFKAQKNILIGISNDITDFNKLKNRLVIDKDLYSAVSKRLAETTLTEALETNNIKSIQMASFPHNPLPSRNGTKILLSVVVALALGAGLALFMDSQDKRFKSVDEAEQYLGVPFLGMIPSYKGARNKPIALYNPGASASEAYRTLRTWIQLSSQSSVKTLLITSANPGEGKSHTATNLAISFAQLGRSVLLVDADLRRPMLHHIFNVETYSGLADILTGKAEWKSVLQDTVMENLKVLPAGGKPYNPAELLSTKQTQSLLGSLKEAFDIVIVDAPVTLFIPDVAILASTMDAVLLIHCPVQGDRETVLEAKKTLDRAGAKLLGIIFNNIQPKIQKYYYRSRRYRQYPYEPTIPRQRDQESMTFVNKQLTWKPRAGESGNATLPRPL